MISKERKHDYYTILLLLAVLLGCFTLEPNKTNALIGTALLGSAYIIGTYIIYYYD